MIRALRTLVLLTPGVVAPAVLAPAAVAQKPEPDNKFLAGWLEEQLSRDVPAAVALYLQAADDETLPRSQRALALARLGEQHWMQGRGKKLDATYQALAGLGIDLGDRGNPIPADRVQGLGHLSKQFREALGKPAGKDRNEELGRLRRELDNYLERLRRQSRNPRRAITLRPLLQRVVQHERQPRDQVEDKELQALREQRLKAVQRGDQVAATRLLQQINQKRNPPPGRMRGKRMAWLTELHLRNDTENALRRERMLFRLRRGQEREVVNQMRFFRRRATEEQGVEALRVVRLRVQDIAGRPATSQWEREVLDELDAQLWEHARNDEVMEALELVARLPYRYELLQSLRPR